MGFCPILNKTYPDRTEIINANNNAWIGIKIYLPAIMPRTYEIVTAIIGVTI
jgi:hypothetical protein